MRPASTASRRWASASASTPRHAGSRELDEQLVEYMASIRSSSSCPHHASTPRAKRRHSLLLGQADAPPPSASRCGASGPFGRPRARDDPAASSLWRAGTRCLRACRTHRRCARAAAMISSRAGHRAAARREGGSRGGLGPYLGSLGMARSRRQCDYAPGCQPSGGPIVEASGPSACL